MSIEIYLQVISILMSIIAVIVPFLIIFVGIVYIRQIMDKLDNIGKDVDTLWDKMDGLSETSQNK